MHIPLALLQLIALTLSAFTGEVATGFTIKELKSFECAAVLDYARTEVVVDHSKFESDKKLRKFLHQFMSNRRIESLYLNYVGLAHSNLYAVSFEQFDLTNMLQRIYSLSNNQWAREIMDEQRRAKEGDIEEIPPLIPTYTTSNAGFFKHVVLPITLTTAVLYAYAAQIPQFNSIAEASFSSSLVAAGGAWLSSLIYAFKRVSLDSKNNNKNIESFRIAMKKNTEELESFNQDLKIQRSLESRAQIHPFLDDLKKKFDRERAFMQSYSFGSGLLLFGRKTEDLEPFGILILSVPK